MSIHYNTIEDEQNQKFPSLTSNYIQLACLPLENQGGTQMVRPLRGSSQMGLLFTKNPKTWVPMPSKNLGRQNAVAT